MDKATLNKMVKRRATLLVETFLHKNAGYAPTAEALHNFKEGAAETGDTPTEILQGFSLKHWIAIRDLSREIAEGNCLGPLSAAGKITMRNRIDELIGDAQVYIALAEATPMEEAGLA